MYRSFVVALLLFFVACAHKEFKNPHVLIQTRFGDIEVELYPDKAPKTVAAFLSYVDADYYNSSSFYRILTDENQPSNAAKANLIQGGIWKTNYKLSKSLPGIPHESTKQTGLLHRNGTISLARQDTGTANTEFFICIGNQQGFDYGGENNPDGQGYAAFGKVVKGMPVVMKIYDAPESDQAFDPPVSIYNIKRL